MWDLDQVVWDVGKVAFVCTCSLCEILNYSQCERWIVVNQIFRAAFYSHWNDFTCLPVPLLQIYIIVYRQPSPWMFLACPIWNTHCTFLCSLLCEFIFVSSCLTEHLQIHFSKARNTLLHHKTFLITILFQNGLYVCCGFCLNFSWPANFFSLSTQ